MTGTLQRVIDASQITIAAISYIGEWGEVDSTEDLLIYQNSDRARSSANITKDN